MSRCGFFDAYLVGEEYDRVYLAQHFAAYFASFIANGVYAQHANQLQVMAMPTPVMQVSVEKGQAWINGYWFENTDTIQFAIEAADGVLNRIDSIVLRIGYAERDMWLAVKKGTPAVNPIAPDVTRSADYYELQLAIISIPASSINITQAQITDTRMNQEVCGWVTGVVEQLDTTTLFNQFEAYFQEFKDRYEDEYDTWTEVQKAAYINWITNQETDMENWTDEQKAEYDEWYDSHTTQWQTEFTSWFEGIKNQLGEDVAGELQNQINELNDEMSGYYAMTTRFSDDGSEITQTLENGDVLKTIFVDKNTIVQEWYTDSVKVKQKRIVFSADGKLIEETKEVI